MPIPDEEPLAPSKTSRPPLGTASPSNRGAMPRPILKWAGGKTQLLGELVPRVVFSKKTCTYHEPFVGGGALFFELARTNRLPRKARLSDSNQNLIEVYEAVQQDVSKVIALLQDHKQRHCETYFYEARASVPDDVFERAARIIYLNKTCFNGLYRENSKGTFNVPFGRYVNPPICDEPNLIAASGILTKVVLQACPFGDVLYHAKPGDFVYFDPPYHPISKTSSFTAYGKDGFGEEDQRELADVFRQLAKRGVYVLLSNSMTEFVMELYHGFVIETVYANRSVNSKADGRGQIQEALVRNYVQ